MKLTFSRDSESEIKLKMDLDGVDKDFNYINFIKDLYYNKSEIATEYTDEITEEEKIKISEMLEEIKTQVLVQSDSDE